MALPVAEAAPEMEALGSIVGGDIYQSMKLLVGGSWAVAAAESYHPFTPALEVARHPGVLTGLVEYGISDHERAFVLRWQRERLLEHLDGTSTGGAVVTASDPADYFGIVVPAMAERYARRAVWLDTVGGSTTVFATLDSRKPVPHAEMLFRVTRGGDEGDVHYSVETDLRGVLQTYACHVHGEVDGGLQVSQVANTSTRRVEVDVTDEKERAHGFLQAVVADMLFACEHPPTPDEDRAAKELARRVCYR